MWLDLFVYAYAIMTGFVAGGLLGSFYELITGRRVSFDLLTQGGPLAIVNALVLVLAGPAVLMRNAIRAQYIEQRPGHWLALSTLICALWSFMSGLFVLSIVVAMRSPGLT